MTTGHRRFGRDARDASGDELVEHGVADDEHVGARHAGRRASAPGQARAAAASIGRAAANGSVISTRKSIRNSESPKLYSNSPAASIAASDASAAAASTRSEPTVPPPTGGSRADPALRNIRNSARATTATNPSQTSKRRQAALRCDLQRHVVQMRVRLVHGVVRTVLCRTRAAPCWARRR